MNALKEFWSKRSKKQKTVITVLIALAALGGIGNLLPDSGTTQQENSAASGVNIEELKQRYLDELDAVEKDYFVSDKAAFGFIKTYCQNLENGNTPSKPDAIANVVASYCETALAEEFGVTPAPEAPSSVDVAAYKKKALDEWGVGLPEADGSASDPVQLGMSMCDADIDLMTKNLGAKFKGSFQEFALTTFCPEKLP